MALAKRREEFEKALRRLREANTLAVRAKADNDGLYEYLRGSTIQRFEFTLEIAWKTMKNYLLDHEGVECRSPKSCIRAFFTTGHMSEEETTTMLRMVNDRNLATHTYYEELAETLFWQIGLYLPLLKKLLQTLTVSHPED